MAGGDQVALRCKGYMGGVPNPFPINTVVLLELSAYGGKVIGAWGTLYPSLEVWEYGAPGGPRLIAQYDATGANPYFDLWKGVQPMLVRINE